MEDKVNNILDKVNVKATKNDIEACHQLGYSRETILRFVNGKHLTEALKNKKIFMSADLTSIGLEVNTKLFCLKTCLILIIKLHFTAKCSDKKGW